MTADARSGSSPCQAVARRAAASSASHVVLSTLRSRVVSRHAQKLVRLLLTPSLVVAAGPAFCASALRCQSKAVHDAGFVRAGHVGVHTGRELGPVRSLPV